MAPGGVVEGAAALDAEVLRHRDLHAFDVAAIPERLQDRIRKAHEQHVVDRALSEVMVDAEDVLLDERAEQDPVQVARRRRGPGRRASRRRRGTPFAHPDCASCSHDGSEERGRDRQVVRGVLCASERLSERREGRCVACSPRRRSEAVRRACRTRPGPGRRTSRRSPAPARATGRASSRPWPRRSPARRGAAPGHGLQRGEDLLVRQIARRPEEHERVRTMCRSSPILFPVHRLYRRAIGTIHSTGVSRVAPGGRIVSEDASHPT